MSKIFTFEPNLKISDLLTTCAVVISLIALLTTISKDREAREREAANQVRAAAAQVITKLDRWQALQLGMYQEMQPKFVKLSEMLRDDYDVIRVRDQFWFERTRIARVVADEQLGTAYADLIAHFPAARAQFVAVLAKLSATEAEIADTFLAAGEQSILMMRERQSSYTTATLGNALRGIALYSTQELKKRSEDEIAPLRQFLFSVIKKPDAQILKVSQGD